MATAVIELPGLRQDVAAMRVPRGVLYHDALRWRLLLVPDTAKPESARKWLEANGLHAGAPVPPRSPRVSQIFIVHRGDAPAGELHLPAGARFSCVACGRSCRSLNLGPLEPADADRLVALDWSGTPHDPSRFFVERDGAPADEEQVAERRALFLRREDDHCQFLREDNLCEVHARFGAAAKPQMCRAFPLQLRASPGGVVVGVRLGECLSAEAASAGESVSARPDEVRGLYDELAKVPLLPPLVWLTGDGALVSWAEYETLEARALAGPPDSPGAQHGSGIALLLRALALVEARGGGAAEPPASPEELDALVGWALAELAALPRGLPLAHAAAPMLDAGALALELKICRLVLFNKDALQHMDVASGLALLAVEAWLARRRALQVAALEGVPRAEARHLNFAWRDVTRLAMREHFTEENVSARALAAAVAALPPAR